MSTSELVAIDRSMWTQSGPAIAATALPTAMFVLPSGVLDIDGMMRFAESHPITGVRITDARRVDISDDAVQLLYKAEVGHEGASDVVFWCSSTYVRFKRRWRLVTHHRAQQV